MFTANTGVGRTRKRQDICEVSVTILQVCLTGHRTQRIGTGGPKFAVVCYECQGLGHFAKECFTRIKRQEKIPDPRGRGAQDGA